MRRNAVAARCRKRSGKKRCGGLDRQRGCRRGAPHGRGRLKPLTRDGAARSVGADPFARGALRLGDFGRAHFLRDFLPVARGS